VVGRGPPIRQGFNKLQHGWIKSTTVKKSRIITVKPYTAKYGRVNKLVSQSFKPKQYLLLENRKLNGFDFNLPGKGLLVWRVAESGEQETPDTPGLYLVQADGRQNLEDPGDWNQGDAGDPFPGSAKKTELKDTGSISTSFLGARSGITLQNIRLDPATGAAKLYAKFSAVGPSPVKGKPSKSGRKIRKALRTARRGK